MSWLHRHKKVHDTQGAIYCLSCHKFFGWKSPNGTKRMDIMGGDGVQAWGYILNGPRWLADKMKEIQANDGRYW